MSNKQFIDYGQFFTDVSELAEKIVNGDVKYHAIIASERQKATL